MPDVAFDRFYRYDELTEILQGWAEEQPELVRVESIGTSYEGRDIWLATVTNFETGPTDEKPALFVEANIHAIEVTGCDGGAAPASTSSPRGHGSDPKVTRCLDTRVFYVVPRLNPDGVELALADKPKFVRSSVASVPAARRAGRARRRGHRRRRADPDDADRGPERRVEGPSRRPAAPGPARPRRGGPDGTYYRLLPEGLIHELRRRQITVAPAARRPRPEPQLPEEWKPEGEQYGAGPFPTSEPEVARARRGDRRAAQHHRRTSRTTRSRASILRPYGGYADDHFPTWTCAPYKLIGAEATKITGYRRSRSSTTSSTTRRPRSPAASDDWFYDHLGVYAWTTEFWSPIRAGGHRRTTSYIEWIDDHPVEDDLKLLRWNDEKLDGEGLRRLVRRSTIRSSGQVELGGWDFFRTAGRTCRRSSWRPRSRRTRTGRVCAPADLAAARGQSLRRGRRRGRGRTGCGSCVENTGWLPTNVTQKAIERKAVRPLEVELDAAGGRRARRRRAEDRGGPARGPRAPAKRPLVGRRRLDRRPDEARVGDRGARGWRARDRGEAPAGRHGPRGCLARRQRLGSAEHEPDQRRHR